tara:strand:+ start:294 stop:518 length:225 start_codon:yes stop_codon:yes gene_type:complete
VWSSEIFEALTRLEYCIRSFNIEYDKQKSMNECKQIKIDELQKSVKEIELFLENETFSHAMNSYINYFINQKKI